MHSLEYIDDNIFHEEIKLCIYENKLWMTYIMKR